MAEKRQNRDERSSGERAAAMAGTLGAAAGTAADAVRTLARYGFKLAGWPLRLLPGAARESVAGAVADAAELMALLPLAAAEGVAQAARGFGAPGENGDARPTVRTFRDRDQQAAIVFVHGFGLTSENTFGKFPELLQEDSRFDDWDVFAIGYSTNLWIDLAGLWSASPPIDRLARFLETVVGEPPLDRYDSIAFVAHSMGGLVVQRALVDSRGLVRRVGHLICYGTPSGGLAKATLAKGWKRQIRDMAVGSPFITDLRHRWQEQMNGAPPFEFLVVAGDTDEFVPSRSSLEPFDARFRAVVSGDHCAIVRPQHRDDLNAKVLFSFLLGEAAPAGPWNSARLAVEGREFQKAIDLLLPNAERLDAQAKVTLAIALDSLDRRDEAVAVLGKAKTGETDLMGTLAGRLKRRWLQERFESDAVGARELYRQALELAEQQKNAEQAYYHAINLAFLQLAYEQDHAAMRETARRALEHAGRAREGLWRSATEGEAQLYLGDDERALEHYAKTLAFGPKPWQIASTFHQALRVTELLGRTETGEKLARLFRQE